MFRITYRVFLCKMILWSGGDHSKKQGVQIRHSDEAERERGCCRLFAADIGFLVTQESEKMLGNDDERMDILTIFPGHA